MGKECLCESPSESYEARTGWVVKVVTAHGDPASPFVWYTGRKLEGHLTYELGHAAVLPRGHTIVEFGALRLVDMDWLKAEMRRRLGEEEPKERVLECPICGAACEGIGGYVLVAQGDGWALDRNPWAKTLDGPPPPSWIRDVQVYELVDEPKEDGEEDSAALNPVTPSELGARYGDRYGPHGLMAPREERLW